MRDYDYSNIGQVEDYTDAFLVCAWVILFMGLVTFAVLAGFWPALIVGWLAARGLNNIRRAKIR
jgi:uncharacterized membrane protein YiaA